MVHGQGPVLVGKGRQQIVQALGQHPGNVPFEQVAVGIDRVAFGGKFQIGRDVDQPNVGASLLELPPQCDAIGAGHIHIQKRKLIQLQIRRAQRLGRTGADDGLQLDRPSFEIIVDIVCHTRTERRVVVTNQNVHPKFLSAAKGSPYCKRSPRTPSVSHPLDSLLNEGAH